MSGGQTLVVVGNGMTSHALCRRLAECGATRGELRVIVAGEEPRPAYDRVHLTDLLTGRSEDDLTLAPASWYAEHDIELIVGDPVVAIDRDACAARTASGAELLFDRLVLATGSRPFVPPVPGADLDGVFVYRTVEDLRAIAERAARAPRAAVIGGGLLGLEAARAIAALGLEVHVIEASPGILPRQLDAIGARLLRSRIEVEALGVRVRTAARTARIDPGARGVTRVITFEDGSKIEVDLVVFATGVRPRGELALAAGLATSANGAVIVDDHLATSDARIFAVGECASHAGTTYGLVAPGYRMVDVLVNNLGGGDAVFSGAATSARLKLMGVQVAALGRHDERLTPGATAHMHLAGDVYRKLVVADGHIVGATAVGPWEDLARVEQAISEPRRFSFWDLRRFRGTGSLFLAAESPPVHLWPADALVCGCLSVPRRALTDAELAGATSVEALSARTGAGTLCGSCRPLLGDYLRRRRADSLPPGDHPEDTPPTLRCNAEGDGPSSPPLEPGPPSSRGPLSARTAIARLPSLAWKRPAFDTLQSGSSPPSRAPSACGVKGAGAPIAAAAPEPALFAITAESLPIMSGPISSIRDSRVPISVRAPLSSAPSISVLVEIDPPSREASLPPSSRRASLPPLRPLSLPPSLLPSVPPPRSTAAIEAEAPRRARRVLLGAGAVTLVGAIAIALAPPVAPAPSIRGLHLDHLIADRLFHRASGYAVIALSVAGLALSLRKRVKRFTVADVPSLRALHAALGAAAVLCLFAHTGMRLGARLNRWRMIDFLALSVLGGVAAVDAAIGRVDAAGQARRARLFRAHVFLLVPLPALLVLHVVAAHYFSP